MKWRSVFSEYARGGEFEKLLCLHLILIYAVAELQGKQIKNSYLTENILNWRYKTIIS
jgi:hypothetical protein